MSACSSETPLPHLVKITASEMGRASATSAAECTNSIVVTCFFRSQAAFILVKIPHVSSPPSTPSVSLCLSPFCFSVCLSSLCLPSRQACFMLCRMFIIRQCCSRGLSILSIKNMSCCSLTPIVVESQFCSLSMGVSGEKKFKVLELKLFIF